MDEEKTEHRFAEAFARFRTGKWFVFSLVGFLVFWITWNTIPGIWHPDKDWSILNIILSVEAAFAVPMLMMANEKEESVRRKQLTYIEHLMQAMLEMLKAQKENNACEIENRKKIDD